jgi:hypothetical protein
MQRERKYSMNNEWKPSRERDPLVDELRSALISAEIQLEYLYGKLQETGNGKTRRRIRAAIQKADAYLDAPIAQENRPSSV